MSTIAEVTRLPGLIPQWNFGDRLRKARREYTEFTQEQMAEQLGVTLKAYSSWEAGRSNGPRNIAQAAVKLEEITGIPKTWFLGWNDDEGPAGGANLPSTD
ncbi:MAG: XRE family transcriptional regulator [Candidatus Leucobacter sulfamidivorax]|nr:XRE family transcriptional regulator [Candidatus Leucobacter sulfamidivorax]